MIYFSWTEQVFRLSLLRETHIFESTGKFRQQNTGF